MKQRAATLIKPISGGDEARVQLEKDLRAEGDRIQGGQPGSLHDVPGLHFLSFFVVPAADDEAAQVVLEASFDGSRRRFLENLVEHCPTLLDSIYRYCEDYPGRDAGKKLSRYLERAHRRANLFYVACPGLDVKRIEAERKLRNRVAERVDRLSPPDGRPLEFVREIWNHLDQNDRDLVREHPRQAFWVRHSLRNGLARGLRPLVSPITRWLVRAAAWGALGLLAWQVGGGSLPARFVPPDSVVRAATVGAGALAAVVALGLFGWLTLLLVEFPARVAWRARLRVLAGKLGEAAWVTLRAAPGFATILGAVALASWHGRTLLEAGVTCAGPVALAGLSLVLILAAGVALWLPRIAGRELNDRVDDMSWDAEKLERMCRREQHGPQNHFVSVTKIKEGQLRLQTLRVVLWAVNVLARILFNRGDLAGISSIHFARWLILQRSRRLLFVTNYDGGWAGYLGEFVNNASRGITAIWGNTGGFPRPFYLAGGGSRDEQRFKCYARESQLESLLWYRRYPDLTVADIERNRATRNGLLRFSEKLEAEGAHVPEAELDTWLRRF